MTPNNSFKPNMLRGCNGGVTLRYTAVLPLRMSA